MITENLEKYFVYENELQQLLNAPWANSYLYGGRGVGKSTFLHRLQERLGTAIWIDGSNWYAAEEKIGQLDPQETAKNGHLIIDDLDQFCAIGYEREGDRFEETVNRLDELFKRLTAKGWRVYATGTRKPQYFLNMREGWGNVSESAPWWQMFWSYIDMSWDHFRFNPWKYGWESNLHDWLLANFSARLEESQLQLWGDLLVSLTGGHPSLLKAALLELQHLLAGKELTPLQQRLLQPFPESDTEIRRAQTRRYLEDSLVLTGLKRLRRALQSLREMGQTSRPELSGFLIRLAQGEVVTPPYDVREILTDHAIIYLDEESGRYRIPGDLLTNEILRFFPPAEHAPQMNVEADAAEPKRKGMLIYRQGPHALPLRLSGSSWQILNLLDQNKGQVVSVEQLQKELHKSEYAVRSALQRLENKLKEIGADNLLENSRGKGYRLKTPDFQTPFPE
ncbi:winged helix-turn-helix transcriptional regulator [candidate division KSB1 bacterium]|nr:winged helix-turn-helix transcriptional regulator [candidate division KSB1 bacterium]